MLTDQSDGSSFQPGLLLPRCAKLTTEVSYHTMSVYETDEFYLTGKSPGKIPLKPTNKEIENMG